MTNTIPTTLAGARVACALMGIKLTKVDGEYRVCRKDEGEASAYYTNDLEDAVRTAMLLHT